ncbi:DHH family phosphoesterase [Halobacteriales archaeon QS_1_68_20]|nr:MAG: DHH family phosphoesterase [Halobacteriales archaeon QS_1_68_20]
MVTRLVLGCGTVGRRVVDMLDGDVVVLDRDEARIEGLCPDGVTAERVDVTDATALSGYDPTVVFVAGDDPETNRRAIVAAHEAFPTAHVTAFAPGESTDGVLSEYADAVLAPGAVLVERMLDLVGTEAGLRARRLRTTLQEAAKPLAVVMHDNPDPDAIGSAVALVQIAERFGVEAVPCYYGEIAHQENRALVNLLDLDLRHLQPDDTLAEFGGFALVDHSRPGVNDQLPPETAVDVVIDHHPPRAPVEARFVDLRHEVGATSTLMVEYVNRLGVDLDDRVATALLYGIRVDTDDFSREVSTEDFEASATLLPDADLSALDRIENPSMSGETLDVLGRAVGNRQVHGSVLVSYVGSVGNRDALAQAADLLVGMNDVATTLVFGTIEDTVFASARARGTDLDLGETLRIAFDQIGSAGGHADMAGAQIPLRSVTELPAEEERDQEEVVETVIAERFLETVESRPPSLTDRFGTEAFDFGVMPGDLQGSPFVDAGEDRE